jgi:hypothetical protein
VRLRQALSLAMDRQAQIDSIFEGVAAVNGPLLAALDDWALPINQLGEGAKLSTHNVAEPKCPPRARLRPAPSQSSLIAWPAEPDARCAMMKSAP